MILYLLCLGLLLLGPQQTKSQDYAPTMIKTPLLNKVPLQPDFQDDKFQGRWYALGVADSPIRNGNGRQLTMYSVNYELKDDHSFNVNTTMLSRGKNDFTIYAAGTGGILSYVMRVAATNYKQFAMVYVEKNVRFKWHFQATLYGRTKKLSHKLKERFVKFSKSVDFTEDNIAFFVPIGNDQLGRAGVLSSCSEAMALSLLCLGLTLLGSLQTQAQDTSANLKLRPDLIKVPLQQDFQDDQFQGKWYIIAEAEDPIQEVNQLKMHSVTYELQDDHSYNLTATMLSGDACEDWVGSLVPSELPGQFTLNYTLYDTTGSYTVRVVITDYNQYAIVFFKETVGGAVYFKAILYGSEAMALYLPCLGLILLGAVQTKAQGFFPTMMKTPHLNKVPLQPDFQDDKVRSWEGQRQDGSVAQGQCKDKRGERAAQRYQKDSMEGGIWEHLWVLPFMSPLQFQGKWYALGVADSTIRNGNRSQLTMYSVNYELKDDHSLDVNTTMLRDKVCEHSVETLVPAFQPGQFILGNLTSYTGVMSYVMRVAAAKYNKFAMVYVEKIVRFKWYYKMTLYGRTKRLKLKLKQHFIKFATSLDFMKDNIVFSVPIDPSQKPVQTPAIQVNSPSQKPSQATALQAPARCMPRYYPKCAHAPAKTLPGAQCNTGIQKSTNMNPVSDAMVSSGEKASPRLAEN
ncbi:Neutrophil gelatinase-associated lipocalin [Fukomys damarensis]|uniref:Neutrophil gelatinase-associated lipocalin n=1 Tax=Fukomys damarensis TaxID=885580 RepID=A0A091DN33_FUKDA|nr:Neutrophil gelatinase-associated lipocalin [Fukomys damarensis]